MEKFKDLRRFIFFKKLKNMENFRHSIIFSEENLKINMNKYFLKDEEIEEYFDNCFQSDLREKMLLYFNNNYNQELNFKAFLDTVFYKKTKNNVNIFKLNQQKKRNIICSHKTKQKILYYYAEYKLKDLYKDVKTKIKLTLHKKLLKNIVACDGLSDEIVILAENNSFEIIYNDTKIFKEGDEFVAIKNYSFSPKNFVFNKFFLSKEDYKNKKNFKSFTQKKERLLFKIYKIYDLEKGKTIEEIL